MQKRLKLFKESRIIKKYTFLEYKYSTNFLYYKAKLELINHNILHIKEFVTSSEYLYSFHWQEENGNLIIRWDNSPHHKSLKTYPHHKHTSKLEESYETTLNDVLKFIEKRILK